jgi:hypothetical protein
VTFDPTPAESPARGRAAEEQAAAADLGAAATTPDVGGQGNLGLSGDAGSTDVAADDAGGIPWPIVGGAAALALLGAAALVVTLVRRRPPSPDDAVAELHRALRRSGRRVAPDTTLHGLAGRFAGTAAEGYLRQLSDSRFGARATPPTRAQRAGLRRALGAGLGPMGRARAWWAVPPRPPGAGRG